MSKREEIEKKLLDALATMDPASDEYKKVLSVYGNYMAIEDKHDDALFSRDVKVAEVDLKSEEISVEQSKIENTAKNAKKDRVNKVITTVIGVLGSLAGIFIAANLSEENVFSREAWSLVDKKPR